MPEYYALPTPYYLFDAAVFASQASLLKQALPKVPLCYAMKANSFLLHHLPDEIQRVEVCSPGELRICERLLISPEKILYSGVMKEQDDINEAIQYGVQNITAESLRQFQLISRAVKRTSRHIHVLLRLTSGNQFGMDLSCIKQILDQNTDSDPEIIGIHYYSGTQKKKAGQIVRDLKRLEDTLLILRKECGFTPSLVEYGPGIATEYFATPPAPPEINSVPADRNMLLEMEAKDKSLLSEVTPLLMDFASKWPLTIELGRFLAASAGSYFTTVKDIKNNEGIPYVITDGGIHQLKYYGQLMSMQVPPILIHRKENTVPRSVISYCLCGSLCTSADVLVREVSLPELQIGDILEFTRCGAYSATEASGLFLSRKLPYVFFRNTDGSISRLRDAVPTDLINA